MVEQYCVSCHNTTDWAGQLALDVVDHSHSAIPGDAETWEKVIKRLRGRLMPPPGEKRPSNEQLDSFVHWLEGTIDASAGGSQNPARPRQARDRMVRLLLAALQNLWRIRLREPR